MSNDFDDNIGKYILEQDRDGVEKMIKVSPFGLPYILIPLDDIRGDLSDAEIRKSLPENATLSVNEGKECIEFYPDEKNGISFKSTEKETDMPDAPHPVMKYKEAIESREFADEPAPDFNECRKGLLWALDLAMRELIELDYTQGEQKHADRFNALRAMSIDLRRNYFNGD